MKRRLIATTLLACFATLCISCSKPAHATSPAAKRFIAKMLPHIQAVNAGILRQRKRLLGLYATFQSGNALSAKDNQWLGKLAKQYKVQPVNLKQKRSWQALLQRVDMVPVSLTIAQAAHESAWGRSRFAREGHNYFGQWCFHKGCGMVPKRRPAGRKYEAQSFRDMDHSIASYMRNLNTSRHYKYFRRLRAQLRQDQKQPNGESLLPGIAHYNPSRGAYVKLIESIISRYNLGKYDHA